MYTMEYKGKGTLFKSLRQNPSFLKGLETKETEIRAIEAQNGVFNVILVVGGAEVSDLVFAREKLVINEINTYKGVVPVITYSVVGYDLSDSKQLVLLNKTNLDAVKSYLRRGNVVFSSRNLYKSLNREETSVLRRERRIRHGHHPDFDKTSAELEYSAENGYLSEFVQDNAGEVWNWLNSYNYDFEDETQPLHGVELEITSILEELREEDNSMTQKTEITDYLPSNSGTDSLKAGKSKYNTKYGVVGFNNAPVYPDSIRNGEKLFRAIFKGAKVFNRKMDKKLESFDVENNRETVIRQFKAVQYRTPVMDDCMAELLQREHAEAEFEEIRLNLFFIAQNISFEQELKEEKAELKRLEALGVYNGFITAKQYAEYLERTGRQ